MFHLPGNIFMLGVPFILLLYSNHCLCYPSSSVGCFFPFCIPAPPFLALFPCPHLCVLPALLPVFLS